VKRKYLWLPLLFVALAFLVLLGQFVFGGGGRSYSDVNAFRARFNQDKGKVRLVMLLSPT